MPGRRRTYLDKRFETLRIEKSGNNQALSRNRLDYRSFGSDSGYNFRVSRTFVEVRETDEID